MKNAKLWSLLCVAALLCACIFGALALGADAAEATVFEVGNASEYTSIEEALAEAESLAEAGELTDAGVKLFVSDSQTAYVDDNGILFGQKTIWLDKAAGKKLPITIEGADSTVSIGMPAENVACANDYTFADIQVAIGAQSTVFYAGSGNVVFERVTFGGTSGKFFADNFTQAAYEGWPLDYSAMKKDGLVESSLTFGENSEYFKDSDNYMAAVGYAGTNNSLSSMTSKITSDSKIEQAKTYAQAATFKAATGLSDLPDIKPVNTRAVLILDSKPTASEISGKSNCFAKPTVRADISPVAEAELRVLSGVVKLMRADKCNSGWETFVGDSYLNIFGGTFTNLDHGVRGLRNSNTIGSFYCTVDQIDEKVETRFVGEDVTGKTCGLQMTFNDVMVSEECHMTIKGGHVTYIYGGGANKKVVNTITGGEIWGVYGARTVSNNTCEVINRVSGGTFTRDFRGIEKATKVKSVTNIISGGTFNGTNFYPTSSMQSSTEVVEETTTKFLANNAEIGDNDGVGATVKGLVQACYLLNSGKIVYRIEAGTFNGAEDKVGTSVYLGAIVEHKGGIEVSITGGYFKNYVFIGGGSKSSKISNENNGDGEGGLLPSIQTTIEGGEFHGVWAAFGIVSGDVVNTIKGGLFQPYNNDYVSTSYNNAFAGSIRNTTDVLPNVTNYIYGGTFKANFYAGAGLHGADATCSVVADSSITTYLYGGTFEKNVYANAKHPATGPLAETAEMIVDPSKSETPLVILGAFGATDGDTSDITIVGGEEITIGANTDIVADSVVGKLTVNQTEGWKAHNYLTIPAGAQYEIIESAGIYGTYSADDTILVKGGAATIAGATLRLSDRVGVRVLLDKASVDTIGRAFNYKVVMGGKTVAKGTFADLTEYEGYYSFIVEGIGLTKFAEKAAISGDFFAEAVETSVVDLATLAQTAWADNAAWKAYADAVIELDAVYNTGAENTLTPAAVTTQTKAELGDAADIASASATLLMSDAAGVRLEVTLNNAPANAKILVNGEEIPADFVAVDGAKIAAEFFFAHEYLAETFVVTVQSDAGVHMTYTASIEAMAAQIAADDTAETYNNVVAFLCYIQAAVACK